MPLLLADVRCRPHLGTENIQNAALATNPIGKVPAKHHFLKRPQLARIDPSRYAGEAMVFCLLEWRIFERDILTHRSGVKRCKAVRN